ncbi:uncharacterized protein LOC135330904 [Halichondria panicea]|uniref:uncharacterized protein LOC135330904 n=1 Tax=Halichondria panicea TaxID=6063 RepID=UPI00312B45E3
MSLSDVFVQIRNKFDKNGHPSEVHGPGHRKVLARDDNYFITELPEKWRVDYDRRAGHENTGYFSCNYLPYVTFDNLKHTDVYDLIGDHLGIVVQNHWYYMQTLHLAQFPPQDSNTETNNSPNTIIVVCDGSSGRHQSLPHSRHAGLFSIRVVLGSNTRTIMEMAAGSSFRETSRLEEVREKYLTEMREPKEVKQGGHYVSVNNPSGYLLPLLHTASSKTCLVSDQRPPPKYKWVELLQYISSDKIDDPEYSLPSGNLFLAMIAAHFKMPHMEKLKQEEDAELFHTKKKVRRKCLAKLNCVHAILCCLHNIRTRDLRSKEPLSFITVKALSQKVLNKDQHSEAHHHLTPHRNPSPITNHSTHHIHGRNRNYRGHNFPLVETWEDLVHINKSTGEKMKSRFPSLMIGTSATAGSSSTLPKLHSKEIIRGEPTGTTEANLKPQRVLPLWQRQVVYVKHKEEEESFGKHDPAKNLSDCIESFQYFKSDMSRKAKISLDERKQQLEKRMMVKVANLKLGVNVNHCLGDMRTKAYQLKKREEAEENRKPKWYVLLEKQVAAVFERRGREPEPQRLLAKLKQFFKTDQITVPHILEKLCLLFMSLPANYVSLGPVFTAIQFVTEYIVKTPPTICRQWRDIRKLPSVTTELTDPAYLFGVRV